MLTLLGWLVQLVLGALLAAAVFRLVKSPKGLHRVLGWGVGALFSWYCLKSAFWDVRLILWGHLTQAVPLLIHGYLLAATSTCLVKGVRQAGAPLPAARDPLRRLPLKT